MTTWKWTAPWSPSQLMLRWRELRQAGPLSFTIRFGLLRMMPTMAGPVIGFLIARGTPISLAAWGALAATYVFLAILWSCLTWYSCEARWHASTSPDSTPK